MDSSRGASDVLMLVFSGLRCADGDDSFIFGGESTRRPLDCMGLPIGYLGPLCLVAHAFCQFYTQRGSIDFEMNFNR